MEARHCKKGQVSRFLKDLIGFPKIKTKCRITKLNKHDYECMDSIIVNPITTSNMVHHNMECNKSEASPPAEVQNGRQKITYNHDDLV